MAVKTYILPGFGVVVDLEDGKTHILPGFGVVANSPAAGGISGDLAATEAADTASFAGQVIVAGDLAVTEAPDVADLAGQVTVSGDLTASEATDLASFAGHVIVAGDLAATEAADMAALIGTISATGGRVAPWTYQIDACRQGPIVAEGRRQYLTLDVVFDPVKAETP